MGEATQGKGRREKRKGKKIKSDPEKGPPEKKERRQKKVGPRRGKALKSNHLSLRAHEAEHLNFDFPFMVLKF